MGVVFGTGAFLAAESVSNDTAGQEFRMAVPADQPMKLWVSSRHVTVEDESGAALDAVRGASIPFQATRDKDPSFAIRVTGRAKATQ